MTEPHTLAGMLSLMNAEYVAAIIACLMGGNIFFVQRLVAKLDSIGIKIESTLPLYGQQIKDLKEQMGLMHNTLTNLMELKKDVAILQIKIEHLQSGHVTR